MSKQDDIVFLLSKNNKPTVKQLKTTQSYRFSDYKFKNIAIRMYETMLKDSHTTSNIENLVNRIMSGSSFAKAKIILINICSEYKTSLDKKYAKKQKSDSSIDYDKEYNMFLNQYERPKNQPEFVVTQADIDAWDNL